MKPNEGSLMIQYVLNLLSEEDRCRFEEHLMSCEKCRLDLIQSDPVLASIGTHRVQLVEALHQEGISFEGLRQELLAAKEKTETSQEFASKASQVLGWLFHGRRWVPIAGIVAIVLLIVLLPKVPQPTSPYMSMLSFEKYAYQDSPTRAGLSTSSTNPLFSKGLQAYNDGDYKNAAAILKEVTEESPKEWSGWFFLGVSYYLDKQAKPAIASLLVADSLNKFAMEIEIKWYLSQAYLLDNDPGSALPYLQWVEGKPGDYSSKAKALIKEIHEVNAK